VFQIGHAAKVPVEARLPTKIRRPAPVLRATGRRRYVRVAGSFQPDLDLTRLGPGFLFDSQASGAAAGYVIQALQP
jgi:hypothetical protein